MRSCGTRPTGRPGTIRTRPRVRPRPPTRRRLQLPDLIEGWAVLCRAAGKEGLTSGQAIRELEKDPADHESLRALLTESTRDGKLPSPQQLGNLLGKVRGRVVKGRSLNTSVYEGTNLWFVHTLPTKGD